MFKAGSTRRSSENSHHVEGQSFRKRSSIEVKSQRLRPAVLQGINVWRQHFGNGEFNSKMEGGEPLVCYGSADRRSQALYLRTPAGRSLPFSSILPEAHTRKSRELPYFCCTSAQVPAPLEPESAARMRAVVGHYVIDGPNYCFPFSESENPIVFSSILSARVIMGEPRICRLFPPLHAVSCAIQSYRLVPSSPPSSF